MVKTHSVASKRVIEFIVSLALFMDALDTTIINTAIPDMARSLHEHPIDLKVALLSYLISLAVFIPISGWIADKFGIKRVFIFALTVFTLSSLWCGYSHSLVELVIARSVQGLGGSLMLPLGRLIILRTFKRHEIVDAMNHVIMVVSVGLMLGPLAGGFITDHFSWHWIFWVNIPVGILAICMAYYWLPESTPKKSRPFDVIGFILFGGGLAALVFALSNLSDSNESAQRSSLIIMTISILMLIAYFVHSRKQPYPIIKMELFRIRTFRVAVLGNLLSRLGFGGVPFILPLLLQIGLGYTAQLSGLLLVPVAIGIVLIKVLSLRLLRLIGYKRLLITNTVCVGMALWLFMIINDQTSVYIIACLTFLFGFLISLQFGALNTLSYADLAHDDLSAAASLVSTVQQLAQSFGVAISALFLRYFSSLSVHFIKLTPPIFHQTFFALGCITILSSFLFIRLKPRDGHQMLSEPAQEKAVTH